MIHRYPQIAATLGLYLSEVALIAMAVALYSGYEGSLLEFNSRRALALFCFGLFAALVSLVIIPSAYGAARERRRELFWFPVATNLAVSIAMIAIVEVAMRIVADETTRGPRIGPIALIPYDWNKLKESNLEIWEKSIQASSYLVADGELGWSIGSSRASEDRLYYSSERGIRSEQRGTSYGGVPVEGRIGLFGNSFAFSEEVTFKESLAYALQQQLGTGHRVLNFGVPGYGVDQAYLRFKREYSEWQMPITILAFINDDIYRASNVYNFLKFPWGLPFSKPRFLLEKSGGLKLVNVPNIPPDEMFSSRSIFELPYLNYDFYFFGHNWKSGLLLKPYVSRFLVSVFPRYRVDNKFVSRDAVAELGALILQRFVTEATKAGTRPLVIYLPSRGDFAGDDRTLKDLVIKSLAESGIRVLNLTKCIEDAVGGDAVFGANRAHYSELGNHAAARCMLPEVSRLMGDDGF